jgi:hypothetical protein
MNKVAVNAQAQCALFIKKSHLRCSLFMDHLRLTFWGPKTEFFLHAEMQHARIAHET